jgi:hypothetical protein
MMGLGYETEHPFDDEPETPMTSPALELAKKCGAALVWGWWAMSEEEIQKLVRLAQVQVLRGAANEFSFLSNPHLHLHAMADALEKQNA